MGSAWKAAVVRGSRMLFVRSTYCMYATNGRISNSSTVFLTGRSDRLSTNTSRDRGAPSPYPARSPTTTVLCMFSRGTKFAQLDCYFILYFKVPCPRCAPPSIVL